MKRSNHVAQTSCAFQEFVKTNETSYAFQVYVKTNEIKQHNVLFCVQC